MIWASVHSEAESATQFSGPSAKLSCVTPCSISTKNFYIDSRSVTNVRSFSVGTLCNCTGHTLMKSILSISHVERMWARVRQQKDQTTLKFIFCFSKTNPWNMEPLQDCEVSISTNLPLKRNSTKG